MIDIKEGIIIREDSDLDEIVGNDEFFIQLKENPTEERTKQLRQQIQQDYELRKKIVDLADIWDGKESEIYGKQLEVILNDLGIKDIPEFYSKENMDKFVKELEQDRKDAQIVKRLKEEDFTSGAYSNKEFRYHIKKGFTKEEKQQILQDREDAKIFNALKDVLEVADKSMIMRVSMMNKRDAEKWRTWTDNKETALEEYLENRQILKRLKEEIKTKLYSKKYDERVLAIGLKKILEEEK